MAKKKRRRHRRPAAPPVHSAPDALSHPVAPSPAAPPPPRPLGAEPPTPAVEPVRRPAPPRKRPASRRRRKQRNVWPWIVTAVIVLGIGAIVAQKVIGSRPTGSEKQIAEKFGTLSKAAGCDPVKTVRGLAQTHINGERIKYETSPPAGGPHQDGTVVSGFYEKALSTNPAASPNIYQAVHSQEHGYVVIWYDNLTTKERTALEDAVGSEDQVIVVPYTRLPKGMKIALTAWSKIDYCRKADPDVAKSFVALYRDADTAPEASIP